MPTSLHAWRNYIATKNNGRPFVLIGHSQGSLMLQMLIAREIETNPAVAARMKLAIMPGFNVLVPQGKLVGGTFKKTPLCSRAGRNRLRDQLGQLPREERAAGGRHFRRRPTSRE